MNPHMAFVRVLALIAALASLPISVAGAQSASRAACRVRQGDTYVLKGSSVTFVSCAQTVAAWGAATGLSEALGQWSSGMLKVTNIGAVYTVSNNRWVYKGVVPDSDRDRIVYDACPFQRETYNNVFDTDGCPDTINDLMSKARQDIDAYWRGLFQDNGLIYYPPRTIRSYRGSSNPIRTSCGPSMPGNAFYCKLDNSIYYDLDLLEAILATGEFGDFGVVTVLAHEWGHQIQSQLADENVPSLPMGVELQADCFAGSYGRYIADGKSKLLRLDEGDLEEGSSMLYALGDDLPWFDAQAHGNPEQRASAYLGGIYDFNECLP
ncbi:MAG TPA: neutral zinc metallopeptidase [Herpetosiphonaceae bacterium]